MAKHIVVYHDHCNDGFGAAFIAHQALVGAGHEVELVPASYGDSFPTAVGQRDIHLHILDFSFPVELLLAACKMYTSVTWLDHHKTAIDAWTNHVATDGNVPKNLLMWLSDTFSGAMLAWLHYMNDPVPQWVKYIDDRDRWIFKYDVTKAFHAGLSLYKRTIGDWQYCTKDDEHISQTITEGSAVLRYQRELYEQLMETAHEITIDGIKGLAANVPGQFASDVGHLLCKKSGSFGATYHSNGKGYKFSLRSEGDFDVSAIASKFSGGGHRNASGFYLEHPIDIAASGLTLWSTTDDLTSYCHDAGGNNND